MVKRLLFDLTSTQAIGDFKFHGGADYAIYIFYELLNREDCLFDVVYDPNRYIDPELLVKCNKRNVKIIEVSNKDDIKSVILNGNYSKFYSALPYDYIDFEFADTKFIMVIHGLRNLEMPMDRYEFKYANGFFRKCKVIVKHLLIKKYLQREKMRFQKLLKIKNKEVITVSEHSKYSLLCYYPFLKEEDVKVFYSPSEFKLCCNNNKENFFLLISANRWQKNVYRALLAFDELFSSGCIKDKRVVVLGCSSQVSFFNKLTNIDKFEFIDYVEKTTLEGYFRNAYGFVYPTLNEGFGYPPIMAMRYATPVIASAISSVPEACGDAALYFNPYSVDEIKIRILNISNNDKLYSDLQNKGVARVNDLKVAVEDMKFTYMQYLNN